MIVIFTIEQDKTSHEVVDWLHFFKMAFYIVTPQNIANKASEIVKWIQNNYALTFWFRKWSNENQSADFKDATAKESFKLIEFMYHATKNTYYWLNNPYDYQNNNKPLQEYYAKQVGLKMPKSWIVSRKEELYSIAAECAEIITKSMGSQISKSINGKRHFSYTTKITPNVLNDCPEHFFPSYIQEYIEKEFEIRSFYLDGEFYSMAIFSQTNDKTKIDFRHYDTENPNRNEPIEMPENIKTQLVAFANCLKTNCGSFDLIVHPNGNIYFLEFNPLGQFGMVSKPCNYNLEQRVAEKLMAEHHKNTRQKFNALFTHKSTNVTHADALCMKLLFPIKTTHVNLGFYSEHYESAYATVKDLQKHPDTLC
ncbi:MAG: grasp-with-spasm system ATP-grasp peptide maturase [Salinivirgaceae bacterium]|nr:grasp-with-spasm system ATP-grasp peptide maturase [Salinivirgaceae bacterium]